MADDDSIPEELRPDPADYDFDLRAALGAVVTLKSRVPSYSVVVPGSLPGKPLPDGSPGPSLYCAVIVKRVDAQTRAKTAINELLRD